MKRMHVSLAVSDLDESVRFYAGLFGAEPTVHKADYAKWMLDDPRLNFAIASRGRATGLDHLGIQAEDGDELREVHGRMKAAGRPHTELVRGTCCYAELEKSWTASPDGVFWETFLTTGEATAYGSDGDLPLRQQLAGEATSCC